MSYAVGLGAIFYVPTKRKAIYRIKRVCESTTATSIFLGIVHQNNPELSIGKIKLLLEDETKFIRNPEAIKVCDEHIKLGYGDYVPHWSYRRGT